MDATSDVALLCKERRRRSPRYPDPCRIGLVGVVDPEAESESHIALFVSTYVGPGGSTPATGRVTSVTVRLPVQGAGNLNGMTSGGAPAMEGLTSSRPQVHPVRDLALTIVPRTNATTGMLVDEEGNDRYRGVMVPTYDLDLRRQRAGGQPGVGSEGGTGVFVDGGGADTYEGMPGRGYDTTVQPGEESTGTGLFVDGPRVP
jgi:hypothetical protein